MCPIFFMKRKKKEVQKDTKRLKQPFSVNNQFKNTSIDLWLPTQIDKIENLMENKSWFSINRMSSDNNLKLDSYQFTPKIEQKVSKDKTMTLSKKIKLKLNNKEKKTIDTWFKGYKKTYNLLIDYHRIHKKPFYQHASKEKVVKEPLTLNQIKYYYKSKKFPYKFHTTVECREKLTSIFNILKKLDTKKNRDFNNYKLITFLVRTFNIVLNQENCVITKCQQKDELMHYCINKDSPMVKEYPFLLNTPQDIRDKARRHFISTLESNMKSKKTFNLSYKKWYQNTIEINSITFNNSFLNDKYLYPTVTKRSGNELIKLRSYEQLFESSGSVKISKDRVGSYYIHLTFEKKVQKERKPRNIIALDPGVRKFLTGYDGQDVFEFCGKEFGKIGKYLKEMDIINSRMDTIKNRMNDLSKEIKTLENEEEKRDKSRIRSKLNKRHKRHKLAWFRKIKKVKDVRDDMHKKVCHYLVSNYNHIILPPFETKQMVTKLNSKVSRNMTTWSHYQFQKRLKNKCKEKGVLLHILDEEYTSQICGNCFELTKTSDEIYECNSCQLKIDRDAMAARNIFIKHCCLKPFSVETH